jgi:ATP adenylyltransferase
MDHLYSDRNEYFKRDKNAMCAFCAAQLKQDGFSNLIVHRGQHCFVIMNLYPYNSGHMMIVPNAHTNVFCDLSGEQLEEMTQLMQKAVRVLTKLYCPQGFNVGVNLGEAGGAGIKEHLHWHVIPRWSGDANFITVIGNTRVLPESLEESYQKIVETWATV